MDLVRGSGILMHVTSLPGRSGIGTLGAGARDFVDFLSEAGQHYWQFLPVGPTSAMASHSPYMSFSAFAGNLMFIDLDILAEDGLISRQLLEATPHFSEYLVDYRTSASFQEEILAKAFQEFSASAPTQAYLEFCRNESWLDDYALFMALREKHGMLPWHKWDKGAAGREPAALEDWRDKLAARFDFRRFCQFCFFRQWDELKAYANAKEVLLIGDIPVYVAHDSVDVWANRDCFRLDPESFEPTHVSGVPPDYFSATGQRWGNPLYRWQDDDGSANRGLYDWWAKRFRAMFRIADICRIDHFRGFESFWEIGADEETAVNGSWVKGPGLRFFEGMQKEIGELPIIAEDLGVITPEVTALRRQLGFPGMKILQFAFDSDEKNPYLPHNYNSANTVVYTGTHDNDTTLGWFLGDKLGDGTRARVRRYLHGDAAMISREMIGLALASVARVSLFPMQDVLGFGTDCRMNMPGTVEGNWQWRCAPRYINSETAAWLRDESEFYNRTWKWLK